MTVNVELTGSKELDDALEQILKRAKDMQPVMGEMGNYLQNTIEESFESGRAADGEVWSPLADSTLTQKNKDGSMQSMGKLLYADGTLFESIGYDASSNELAIGVNAYSDKGYPYPVVHHFGSEDGKTPARPFMPFDSNGELYDDVKEELIDLLKDWIAGS